jgi:hypothetical protein
VLVDALCMQLVSARRIRRPRAAEPVRRHRERRHRRPGRRARVAPGANIGTEAAVFEATTARRRGKAD